MLATRLGLAGVPSEGEAAVVARDLLLVELTGARYHVQHLSVARALDEVRRARERGVPVTCEVAPHHFVLTEEACEEYDTNTKMNPPLRTPEDAEALVVGLADGTVDAIATDHAPHVPVEKEVPFDEAPFGVIGLETALPVVLDRLVRPGRIPLKRFVELFTSGPCKAMGLPGGTLAEGGPGDVTVLDLERQIVVDPAKFRSRSRNCPFAGWELTGAAAATVVGGVVKYRAE
jgi:dihydroorotase